MAAPAGSLIVRIGSDISGLTRGVRETESRLSRFGRSAGAVASRMAALGAAAVAAGGAIAVGLVRSGLQAVDAQSKLAQSIGGTIDSVRALQIAASDAGISSQEMTGNLQRMNRRLGEVVSQGAGPAAAWIERLGINAQDLIELPLDQRVAVIADEISKLGTTAEMSSAAFGIFGEAGLRMVPMLQQGGDAIRAAAQEVEDFGLSLSAVDAAQVEQANDAMTRIGFATEALRNQITVAVAGPLKAFAEWFSSITRESNGFREAVSTAFVYVGRFMGVFLNLGGVTLVTLRQIYETATEVFAAVGRGLSWLGDRFREFANAAIRAVNAIADFIPGIQGGLEEIQPGFIGRRFEDAMGIAELAVTEAVASMKRMLGGELWSDRVTRMFEEMQQQARKAAEEAVKARGKILGVPTGVEGEDGEGDPEQEAFARRLDMIRNRFDTEQEALREHRQIMADIDRAWREGEFETEEEYRAVREQAEEAHMERLKRIRERGNDDIDDDDEDSWKNRLNNAREFGGAIASAAGDAGEKLFKVAKIVGAAQAFISTLTGQAEALKLGWPLGPIAAAKIGAQGFGLVAAIKSASMGGGGGGGGGAAASTPDTSLPTTPDNGGGGGQGDFVQDVSVTLVGGNMIGAEQLEQLGEVLSDNGGRIGAFKLVRA